MFSTKKNFLDIRNAFTFVRAINLTGALMGSFTYDVTLEIVFKSLFLEIFQVLIVKF